MSLLDDKLEMFLKHTIEEEWTNFFHSGWKHSSFDKYTQNENAVWNVVKTTVERAAQKLQVPLHESDKHQLRQQFDITFTPGQLLPKISDHFSEMIRRGKQCPPGTTPVLKAKRLPDGSIVYDWECE
jgi:hypothetical protein